MRSVHHRRPKADDCPRGSMRGGPVSITCARAQAQPWGSTGCQWRCSMQQRFASESSRAAADVSQRIPRVARSALLSESERGPHDFKNVLSRIVVRVSGASGLPRSAIPKRLGSCKGFERVAPNLPAPVLRLLRGEEIARAIEPARLQPVTTISVSGRLASASCMTMSPGFQSQMFGS